jgi:peptidoglycan-associated lipoprotein
MVSAERTRPWRGGTGRAVGHALLILAVVLLAAPGCSKKKSTSTDEAAAGQGMNEGNVSGSSLDQFRRGTLGSGEEGPLKDVHFAYDSYELSDSARETIRTNADWLRENPKAKVEIEGHCDTRGTAEYNLALGAKRATAVRDYLVSLGVAADRLTTISYGKELPLCHEETPDCWEENRRAHFAILG